LPESESFGALFGRLVREKRGIEGLSQDGLVSLTGLTKARISDLENGKVQRPQARTIDTLCVALNISRQERHACHAVAGAGLPSLLLENLALRFGHANPTGSEQELAAFLVEKAVEFRQLQARLAQITQTESRIAEILASANEALEQGDFQRADACLADAEGVQLATTLGALERQCELRFARGHAALLAGEVDAAVDHWEAAANFFHFVDRTVEAEKRYVYCDELRAYGYRYRSVQALMAAGNALQLNLTIWTKATSLMSWCRAMNALGGVNWRLAQFDVPGHFAAHIATARTAYEAVREVCSETVLPYYYAISGGNLASLYAERKLSKTDVQYRKSLELGLEIQHSALKALSQWEYPTEWGIFQHNIGNSYTTLFKFQPDKLSAMGLVDNAIGHLELSFEVRNPGESLQYWVASRRSLGEALIEKSRSQSGEQASHTMLRAQELLREALSMITDSKHPHQWAELQAQFARCFASPEAPTRGPAKAARLARRQGRRRPRIGQD
jgi:transcriptional regulator with XRE-family HTH domain